MDNHFQRAYGGYFGLELPTIGAEYHGALLGLNTGRNALEHVLSSRKFRKVYIPWFTCDVVLEPFHKLGISYEFYEIDDRLEIINLPALGELDGLLYTNYFGLKQQYIVSLSEASQSLIVDNSQAFFARPIGQIPTIYSARKFFGVPDGAYVNVQFQSNCYQTDISHDRFGHLLKRADRGAALGYADFKQNDLALTGQPIKLMSVLTRSLLASVNYDTVLQVRNCNYEMLHMRLKKYNELDWLPATTSDGPMAYPFLFPDSTLKSKLIERNIYVPTYWPNVSKWRKEDTLEFRLTANLVSLPIDQRYNAEDMEYIIDTLEHLISAN